MLLPRTDVERRTRNLNLNRQLALFVCTYHQPLPPLLPFVTPLAYLHSFKGLHSFHGLLCADGCCWWLRLLLLLEPTALVVSEIGNNEPAVVFFIKLEPAPPLGPAPSLVSVTAAAMRAEEEAEAGEEGVDETADGRPQRDRRRLAGE